jgi:hypothetical protein
LYCTVSCLKNVQKTKNDALDAYALLILELEEFEPEIEANTALEEGLLKIMPDWERLRVANVEKECDELKSSNHPT